MRLNPFKLGVPPLEDEEEEEEEETDAVSGCTLQAVAQSM